MTSTPTIARDEIFRLFNNAMIAADIRDPADNTPIFEAMPTLRFQGREKAELPGGFWLRISTQQVSSRADGFVQTDEPTPSPNAYETAGLIFVQVFAPMSDRDSYRKGELLAAFVRDIFRRAETQSGVWFRNSRFNEVGSDGKNYSWNVKAEYQYNERKG